MYWSGADGGVIYNLYSGLLALIVGVGLLGGVAGAWHKHSCHQPGCWRISRHIIVDADGTTHGACRKHRTHVYEATR